MCTSLHCITSWPRRSTPDQGSPREMASASGILPYVLLILSCSTPTQSDAGTIIVVVVPTVFSIIFIAVIMTVILVVICIALRPLFRLRNNLGGTPSTIIPTTAAGTHPYAAAQGAPVVLPPTAASNNTQPPLQQQQQGMETSGAHSITRGPTDPQAPPPSYNVAITYPSYNS